MRSRLRPILSPGRIKPVPIAVLRLQIVPSKQNLVDVRLHNGSPLLCFSQISVLDDVKIFDVTCRLGQGAYRYQYIFSCR